MNADVVIAMSQASDGSMSVGVDDEIRLANRGRYLENNDISAEQTILVRLTYGGLDYKRYHCVSTRHAGDGIVSSSSTTADTLFTRDKNVALFLPIADCIAAILYDPDNQVLGLAHLGRHNLLQQGGRANVMFMASEFDTNPAHLQAWLSPAAGRDNYPLFDFGERSLHEVATEQLVAAGVRVERILTDTRDTTTDEDLFSHSEFLKGSRLVDGRQAVVTMMRSK